MTDLSDLVERVRAATGEDLELDFRIAEVFEIPEPWPKSALWPPFAVNSLFANRIPHFTGSADAALAFAGKLAPTLVIKMARIGDGSGHFQIVEAWLSDAGDYLVDSWSPLDPKPPAIAITLATLLAVQATGAK